MSDDDLQDEVKNRDGDDGAEGDAEGGGFNAKKIILIVVLPLFILAGVGGGLYFTGTLDGFFAGEDVEEGATEVRRRAEPSKAYFLEIPNMIVNLSADDGQTRYLRLSVQLELRSQEDVTAVETVMPRVIDQFQTYLRELRVRDLRGSQGIYRLQMELLTRVNTAAYPVEVKDVLFQEILIQ